MMIEFSLVKCSKKIENDGNSVGLATHTKTEFTCEGYSSQFLAVKNIAEFNMRRSDSKRVKKETKLMQPQH